MNKATVDTYIKNMQKAGLVTKAPPWMMEAQGEDEFHIRYVGIKVDEDWADIMSSANNILLKFLVNRSTAHLEFYLANKPPFVKFHTQVFSGEMKWEHILGEVKRQLRKDKQDALKHQDKLGNTFLKIKPYLKH